MRILFLFAILLCTSFRLSAQYKCEIRGHVYDRKSNKPLVCGFRFEKPGTVLVEYVTTDKHGAFVILVKDTGTYYLTYHVGYCKDEKLLVVITDTTSYNLTIDFYVPTRDPDCVADKMVRGPKLIPRLGFTRGWRGMLDASIALRCRPGRNYHGRSHSIAVGAEWNYGFKRYLIGYKVGYTYLNECFAFSGITIGANAVYFTVRSYSGLYLQPQVGFEGIEIFDIIAQYNFSLTSRDIDYRLNHFSLGFRIWMGNP